MYWLCFFAGFILGGNVGVVIMAAIAYQKIPSDDPAPWPPK